MVCETGHQCLISLIHAVIESGNDEISEEVASPYLCMISPSEHMKMIKSNRPRTEPCGTLSVELWWT